MPFSTTALMLNPNGSVYHLHAFPEDIASTIIFVGDPDRVDLVTQHFDQIEVKRSNREFVIQTGKVKNKRITVVGTGIGTGNIDIVMNELDALVNIDLAKRTIKPKLTELSIIRLGTTGTLQATIPVDSLIVSSYAFSFDGLLNYYQHTYTPEEQHLFDALAQHFYEFPMREGLYLSAGSPSLIEKFKSIAKPGITLTCPGFYGPQCRALRAPLISKDILKQAQRFSHHNANIANLEMETAAIYSLGKLFGHSCCSINGVVANRMNDEKSENPKKMIDDMIEKVLSILVSQ